MAASSGAPWSAGDSPAVLTGPVHLIEHHDAAYVVWREAGVRGRILVHIDAHHDMYGGWAAGQPHRLTIGNYVYAALEQGLVREVIWVVPDSTWCTRRGRRDVAGMLKRIDQDSPDRKPEIQVEPDRITTLALGKPLHVCTLPNLPLLGEDILLDIDVDYLVIPCVGHRDISKYARLPWCWPAALVATLQDRGLHTDLATIAYSVDGGYTPLQWKYLGNELAQRLKLSPIEPSWAEFMRQGAEAAVRGDLAAAESQYLAAHNLLPQSAAPCYHLAHLCVALGRVQEGREYYGRAIGLDASYRTAYNSAGFWYLWYRQRRQARRAFERTLCLDSSDAYAHLGLGLLAMRERRWDRAEASLRRALAINASCVDAFRALGRILARRHDYGAAIQAYERSLKLSLSGQRSLLDQSSLGIGVGWTTPRDPDHGAVHASLARLYAITGAHVAAISGYRMAIAGGATTLQNYAGLALVYLRTGRLCKSVGAFGLAVTAAPLDLARYLKRLSYSIRRFRFRIPRPLHTGRRVTDDKPAMWV